MRRLMCALVLALWVSGCSSFTDATQPSNSLGLSGPVTAEETVGQTFVARHGGLNGISLFAALDGPAGDGTAILHLRADPTSERDVARASLPLSAISNPGFYTFSFPAIRDSNGKRYYFLLETQGLPEGSALKVGRSPGEAYLDGAMYRSGQPVDKQLSFQLHYAWAGLGVSLLLSVLGDLGVLLVSLVLFVLPGWALLAYLLPEYPPTWGEMLGLAVGLSLAMYPLLLLWAYAAGLHPGAVIAYVPPAASAFALAWKHRGQLKRCPATVRALADRWCPEFRREIIEGWHHSDHVAPDVALAAVIWLVFAVRLIPVHGLHVPLWADSVQHTAIAQLIADHGGLFSSWLPYWPYRTFAQHFGFHANAAVWSWLTGMDVPRSVLLFGQVLNALSVVTLYPLAMRIGRDRWAGVIAVMVAGLVTKMPAFYVNWGRYAQLAGQAILPTAIVLTWLAIEHRRQAWRVILLAALSVAGMSLAYYRMPYYYAAFWLAWVVALGIRLFWRRPPSGAVFLIRMAGIGGAVILLLLPWASVLVSSNLFKGLTAALEAGSSVNRVVADYQEWRDAGRFVSNWLLAAGTFGLAWSLVRRRWIAALVGLWGVALALIPAAQLIKLPGASQISNFAIVIAMYMPISLMLGWLAIEATSLIRREYPRWGSWLILTIVLVAGGLGARERMQVIDQGFMLVTRPDEVAMKWIRANTPVTAKFLVNGMIYTDGWSVIGGDAGWWIPLLAGRRNTMPPQYALFIEQPLDPAYDQSVIGLVRRLLETAPTSAGGLALLCTNGITHVYLGQGQGMVVKALPNPPERPLLSAQELYASPSFTPVYHADRVWVFALNQQACQ